MKAKSKGSPKAERGLLVGSQFATWLGSRFLCLILNNLGPKYIGLIAYRPSLTIDIFLRGTFSHSPLMLNCSSFTKNQAFGVAGPALWSSLPTEVLQDFYSASFQIPFKISTIQAGLWDVIFLKQSVFIDVIVGFF